MSDKAKYVEVEGIKCMVKDPKRKGVVSQYQSNLREELDKYISSVDRWTDSKKNYREILEINIKTAPFFLGWLKIPNNSDEYKVIKGYMTHKELDSKNKKTKKKPSKTTTKNTRLKPKPHQHTENRPLNLQKRTNKRLPQKTALIKNGVLTSFFADGHILI